MRDAMAFRWSNRVLIPTARFSDAADEQFVEGAVYWLHVEPERTERSHNHEFATIAEAWKQLPDHLAEHFPTSEHLRKRALIDAGFYTETILDVGSNAAALRVRDFAKAEDGFAHVVVRGPVVVVRKAKSQSKRAMGAAEFQRSKQAVLEIVAGLIGVTPEALTKHARAAA
jgi:hypothetical protein